MRPGEHMSGTHDCGGDAAAYSLGALEPAEAAAFERHLAECVVCRDEVEALQGVVGALPMAAPQLSPSRRLRRRVMHAVREEPKATSTTWPVWLRGSMLVPRGALAALTVAAVVAGAVVGGLALSSGSGGGRVIQARVAGISGSVQLRVNDGHADLVVRHLSPPPAGHVYEVWLKAPHAAPVPASVLFSVSASGSADVGLPGRLRGISQVMVTPEPDGGSPAPTHSPVIVASLT